METFFALLVLCAGNSPVTGEFPAQRPVTWGSDIFFDLRLNKRLSKQSCDWCLRHHRTHYDVTVMSQSYDCPSASEATLENMSEINQYRTTTPCAYSLERTAHIKLVCLFETTIATKWQHGCQIGNSCNHRSVTPKFVTPTAPSYIDNSWRSTTLPGADSASSNQTLPFQNEHEWVLEKFR